MFGLKPPLYYLPGKRALCASLGPARRRRAPDRSGCGNRTSPPGLQAARVMTSGPWERESQGSCRDGSCREHGPGKGGSPPGATWRPGWTGRGEAPRKGQAKPRPGEWWLGSLRGGEGRGLGPSDAGDFPRFSEDRTQTQRIAVNCFVCSSSPPWRHGTRRARFTD